MGLCSTHGGSVAALEGGGSGAFDSSAVEAQVERAPHGARARRLGTVWAVLDTPTRNLLVTHYTSRSNWARASR